MATSKRAFTAQKNKPAASKTKSKKPDTSKTAAPKKLKLSTTKSKTSAKRKTSVKSRKDATPRAAMRKVRTADSVAREADLASTAISVGDAVRRLRAGDDGELGRVCTINSIGICCVQFEQSSCMPVPIAALKRVEGNPPACTQECSSEC